MSDADEKSAPQDDAEHPHRHVRRGAIPTSLEELAAAIPYEPADPSSSDVTPDEPDSEESK